MKCVILAAGEGIRMRPLTIDNPKPLLKIAGKPLIEHIIGALPSEIDELILVVGYLGEKIRNYCGDEFFGRPVTYVWQEKKLGTAYALKPCELHLNRERFLMLYADDLHGKNGIGECLEHDRALLIAEHDEPRRFGVVTVNDDWTVREIVEKPESPATNLVSTGAMVLDQNIFKYEPNLHPNGEYYLTSMFDKMLKDYKVVAVKTDHWFPVAAPADLERGEKFLSQLE